MKVQFEYGVEDLVDIAIRGLRQRGIGFDWRWKDLLPSAFFAGLVWYLFSPFFGWKRFAASGVVALVVGSSFPWIHQTLVRRRLKRLCLERMNGHKRGDCEIELRPDGYLVKRIDVDQLYSWDNVVKVETVSGAIEICTRKGDITVVNRRVFACEDDYRTFSATAESFRSQHQVASVAEFESEPG